MNQLTKRQQTYSRISSALACMSNKQLEQMLDDGKAMHKGIGGTSLQIEIDNTLVFVKKVPLTDLELQPENSKSINLIKRLSFRREEFSPKYLKIDGQWRDHDRYAMTLEDYEENINE